MKPSPILLILIWLCLALTASPAPADPLESGFRNPPESAKPQTWWHWMNGNISKAGITADLEAMKQIGLSGATIVNVDSGIPRGNVPFMSAEWREDFKFAVSEANRLGLELCVENCAGWSSSGGPWNTVTNAMQRVTTSETRVSGPTHFSAALPQPPTKLNFYRDIAVLAFPAADAKATIENIAAKSGDNGKAVLASSTTNRSTAGTIALTDVVDITSKLTDGGKLDWQVPAGDWIILRVGYTPTGRPNKPSPKEGEGLECDKLSKPALDAHWAGFMQKMLDDVGPLAGAGKTLNNALIDSYEVGGQNWTENFRAEFEKRRGYDLLKFLPTFTGRVVQSPEVSERFLWDLRRTIADLFAENYFGHFAELCQQHGLLTSIEPYTGPFESLQCGAPADIVMGEFWTGRPVHRSVKLASSVAHIYGKKIVGAESFTAYPVAGRWQNDPSTLKAPGDLAFSQGINRFIFHRYAHQPWTNRWPGMTMGQWGFHFERTVTWWDEGKPWIDYITRSQFLLQQGRSVADVANFCGESVPVETRAGKPATPAGYDYDDINADVLLNRATVKNGRITLPDGLSYGALVLPPEDINMTPRLLERLAELVRAGATIVGPRPQHSPSLTGYPQCDAQVQELAASLWGNCNGSNFTENVTGKGRVVWGKSLTDVFAAQNLKPDFVFAGDSTDTRLEYAHRVADNADIYFVSNQRTHFDSADCTFRVSGKTPELWHADTGVTERAPVWLEQHGRTTVSLKFDPAGSVFVIFREPAAVNHVVAAKLNSQWQTVLDGNGKLLVKATGDGTAEFQTAAGKTLKVVAANMPAPIEVAGGWNLSFPPDWGAPPSVTLNKLISWTDHPNDGVRYFSGTATYENKIEIPADRLGANRELWLDLGVVKNLAEVFLNGSNLGVLWKPPFRVNITSAAKPGTNQLVVKVTNLWPNRLIGDEQLPADVEWNDKKLRGWPEWLLAGKPSPTGRLTFSTWHHWTKDDALLESGLIGPVTLRTVEIIPANSP